MMVKESTVFRALGVVLAAGTMSGSSPAQPPAETSGIRARVHVITRHVPLNHPVWAHFSIENASSEPVTLTVPGTEPDLPSPEVGLPLSHLFSGPGSSASAVTVTTDSGQRWSEPVGFRKPERAPLLMLAPRGTVGATIDLREYFPSLRGAGTFKLNWDPYGGEARSPSAQVTIAPRKQVEITTDEGKLLIQLYYDDAPLHVENFLELAADGFYTGLTFHRIEPGYLIQGGCPRGDGTGIRLDGKRIPAEPNDRPHEKGSVSMALLGDDVDSGSCQFFICNTRMKEWDGRFTVFGRLADEESFATLDRLMRVPVDERGRPEPPPIMRQVRVLNEPVAPYSQTP